MTGKVAYILSRFPKVSETFILREMIALQERGVSIELFPLIVEKQSVVHDEAKPWLEKLYHYPWISPDVFWSNMRVFFRNPFVYLSIWSKMVFENISNLKFLARALLIFPKAVRMSLEMQKIGIRHIHAHFATHPALAAWIIYRLTGISYSITVHAHDIYVSQTMLATKVRAASFIIAISEFNRRFLVAHVGEYIEEKIKIVHCGIDPARYARVTPSSEKEKFSVKSIGSLEAYKGMKYLIQACALLKEQNIPLHCEIIGEGLERPYLQEWVDRLALNDTVFLVGAKTQIEVAEALAEADCYVQPSVITETGKMEGIPVALMEALGSELPVVASDISGISELVRPGETGYLVSERDPEALAEAIGFVFQHPEQADALAKKGRELVEKEFNMTKNGARAASLFEEFLAV